MNVLIVGCGWVGSYCAKQFPVDFPGLAIYATTTTPQKAETLNSSGVSAFLADFNQDGRHIPDSELTHPVFDTVIVSVPVTRKDNIEEIEIRFSNLTKFLEKIAFHQLIFFGSVGIYPKVSKLIYEDSFPDDGLEKRLLRAEQVMEAHNPQVNILRLGGLFGQERVLAKYFQNKICTIGNQTSNAVHIEDVYAVVKKMIICRSSGKLYNVVCPEHPLKKEVIISSAKRHGYDLPSAFEDADDTAKQVSPDRLINDLDYQFHYSSPLDFN